MSSLADLSGSRNLEENLLHPSDLAEAARTTRQPSILSPRKRLRSRGTLLLVRTVAAISRGSRPPMLKSIPSVMEPEQQNSYAAAELVVPPPALLDGSRRMLAGNRLYVLLVAVPVALAAKPLGCSDGVVFGLCCFGILPLAALLGDATEQVALHTNETLSGLLNATFGNATELIVAICALNRGLLAVVQTSLLGSILSNTLLVLGCACLAGGVVTPAPRFNTVAAISNAALLQIAVLGLLLPTIMHYAKDDMDFMQPLSHGISIGLLLLYLLYIYFQLFTHHFLFEAPLEGDKSLQDQEPEEDEEDEEDEVLLSFSGGLLWLGIATVAIAFLSEELTGALEPAAAAWGLPQAFVGFCLLPIVGNAAEHSTAIVCAYKQKMDLALGVALGSSTQIALFVIPVMVVIGWVIQQPLDLFFGPFPTAVTFLSTNLVFMVVQNGETNWLEGAMLLFSYAIICFSFLFY